MFKIEQIYLKMTKKQIDPDIHFKTLRALEDDPKITQRELSKQLGISLGSVNYCIKALIEVGHIKVQNFNKNTDKSVYFYLLTPQGIKKKAALTGDFLKRKLVEYHQLKQEIESIQLKINTNKARQS